MPDNFDNVSESGETPQTGRKRKWARPMIIMASSSSTVNKSGEPQEFPGVNFPNIGLGLPS